MSFLNKVSRRTVMAGQAALAGLAALPSIASARVASTGAGLAPATTLAPRWDTATAEELAPFVGERFRVKTQAHGTLVLKLVAVTASASGDDRPAAIRRREGVVAIFDSPDIAPLVADGEGVHRVHHPRIGSADLYMAAAPRQNGGSYIEVVLN
ncbi:hypothetical protein ABMC88_16790 [Sulfitobacter sp. HNIBRBA2951]|uniref:DUF6916 family protein n=1 Tax=Sulfitobacter aquimarinus TaxID=3158557 RepID=UPI0032DEC6D3